MKIDRRYNEFYALHKTLQKQYWKVPFIAYCRFPPKTVYDILPSTIEYRRKSFETYLRNVLRLSPLPHVFACFLRLSTLELDRSLSFKEKPQFEEVVDVPRPSLSAIATMAVQSVDPSLLVAAEGMGMKAYLLSLADREEVLTAADTTFRRGAMLTLICIAISSTAISAVQLATYVAANPVTPALLRADLLACWRSCIDSMRSAKLCSEVLIVCLLGYFGLQHLLGWVLTAWLNNLLLSPTGAFSFSFEAVSVRVGVEECEITVRNFLWKNPPGFERSPHFGQVQELVVQFEGGSLVDAVLEGTAIKVDYLEVKGIHCFMEKSLDGARLNLWTAIGAETEAAEQRVRRRWVESLRRTNARSGSWAAAQGSRGTSLDSEPLDEKPGASDSGESEWDEGCPGDVSPSHQQPAAQASDEREWRWGVPFRFDVDLLSVRDLRLYAQDLLHASACDSAFDPSRAIKIDLLSLRRRDLSAKADGGKDRRGLYLDDLTWRLIGGLGNELLATNKLAMTRLLATAAASHAVATASAVVGTAIDNIYEYSPKRLLVDAKRSFRLRHTSSLQRGTAEGSAGVTLYGLSSLSVSLLAARDLRLLDQPLGTCYCKLSLLAPGRTEAVVKTKSSVHTPTLGAAEWQETFELAPVLSLDYLLRVELFEASLLGKDLRVGSMWLRLGDAANVSERDCEELLKEAEQSGRPQDRSSAVLREEEAGGLFSERRQLGVRWPVVAWHPLLSASHRSSVGALQLALSLR